MPRPHLYRAPGGPGSGFVYCWHCLGAGAHGQGATVREACHDWWCEWAGMELLRTCTR